MRTLKLTLAYDGTIYRGWQRQAAGPSIQGLLEDALSRLEGSPVTVAGAGRTDAGVHALGQVARARVAFRHGTPTVTRALNAILPIDIRVLQVEDVDVAFHPRFDAVAKTYQYWLWDAPVLPPTVRTWCWHVPRTLDAAQMNRAARLFEGRHDFAAFRSTGTDVTTTVRTVTSSRVFTVPIETGGGEAGGARPGSPLESRLVPAGGRFVVFEIEADGFLRHMVRALTGTLVEIGEGRREVETIGALLDGGLRNGAGATAPALGLVLVRVRYPPRAYAAPDL